MNFPSLAGRNFACTLGIICLCVTLSACARLGDIMGVRQTEVPFYRPPTAAVTVTSPFMPSPPVSEVQLSPTPQPTPTPDCSNNLTFVEDQTIPDGTLVQPGDILDKRWLVENSGTCNWDGHYRLRLIAGADMGLSPEQALYPARGGTQVSIRLIFTAPEQPDVYRSAWQAFSPAGEPFGDPIFIEVQVVPPSGAP